jgi:hypothetical protein
MYKKRPAIAIAGKTRPTRGTRIEGRYKFSIVIFYEELAI